MYKDSFANRWCILTTNLVFPFVELYRCTVGGPDSFGCLFLLLTFVVLLVLWKNPETCECFFFIISDNFCCNDDVMHVHSLFPLSSLQDIKLLKSLTLEC